MINPKLPIQPESYDQGTERNRSSILERFMQRIWTEIQNRVRDGGWRDMIGQIVTPPLGPSNPTWTQMGTSPFYGWRFGLNDEVQLQFHLQHDYKPGTDIFLHTHWTTNGTSTNTVKWQFTYTYAKGFNQGAASTFDIAGGGTVVTVEEAAAGTAWRHMVSEITTAISDADFEVDGILMVNVKRVTNGGTDNADTVFLIVSDCHYQSWIFNTPNRAPDFYGKG